ncbi:hypothetical protein ACFL2H_08580 [Planctomycetota bacterium]
MPDTTANTPPSNQFSLKRMFVATALVALFAWGMKYESFGALFFAYFISCFAIAFTGIGKKGGPPLRGALSGALIPSVLWNTALVLGHENGSADGLVDAVLFGCIGLPIYGVFFGVFAGTMVAAGSSPVGKSSPPS